MPRRRIQKKRTVLPDPVYKSRLIELLVRQIMRKGKKALAYRICYQSLQQLGEATQQDPLSVVEKAISQVSPKVEVKGQRVGGSTYQVPVQVSKERGTALAIRWVLAACRAQTGKPMAKKLTYELLEASKNSGTAIRKRDEVLRMARANKAFAKFDFE